MGEMNDIVKLAVDSYKGNTGKYSVAETQDTLRQALIEANGGSTKLDYRSIRDGKCSGLFTIVEEILNRTVIDSLRDDDFFMNMVDFVNVADGDKNEFVIEDSTLFFVDKLANGTQALRRQRISGCETKEIKTCAHGVRIYEELGRVLSGRVDFNEMINKVAKSYHDQILREIYDLYAGLSSTELGSVYYATAGTYTEAQMLTLVEHVEAASGGNSATIVGTKAALRNLAPSISGELAKNDLYNLGYYGSFFGSNVMAIPQRHEFGTTNFVFSDKVLTVVAADFRPVKFVYEGDPLIHLGDPFDNQDLTQEYTYISKYGCGIVMANNEGLGKYVITA